MASTREALVADTSAFFAKISELRHFIEEENTKLVTLDLVVFEFAKLMQSEIKDAKKTKREERVKMLTAIRDRFPELLANLEIEIISPTFGSEDLEKLYEVARDNDAGDCMIWLKMQKAGLKSIVTQNTSDWKKLGANVVSIPRMPLSRTRFP